MQFAFQARHGGFRRLDLFLREFLHVRVAQHLLRRGDIVARFLVAMVQRHQRAQFGVLARHLAVAVHVRRGVRVHQQFVEFDQAVRQLIEFAQHGWFHSDSR